MQSDQEEKFIDWLINMKPVSKMADGPTDTCTFCDEPIFGETVCPSCGTPVGEDEEEEEEEENE